MKSKIKLDNGQGKIALDRGKIGRDWRLVYGNASNFVLAGRNIKNGDPRWQKMAMFTAIHT